MPQYIPTGAVDVGVSGSFDIGSGYNIRFNNNNYEVPRHVELDAGQAQFQIWW